MNSTKKTIREQSKKQPKKSQEVNDDLVKKIAAGILLVILAAVIIGISWEGLAPKYLISINGDKMKQQDLLYEIYSAEAMGVYMADLYAQFGYTTDYWTMDQGDGTTTQDAMREQVIGQVAETNILYAEAIAAGYELTEDEKKEADEKADQDLEAIGEAKVKKLGITKEKWVKRLEELAIAYRYNDDIVAGFDIDKEAIKATVDYETFRGYDVDYFFAPTTTNNDEGETVEVDDKQSVYKELEAVLQKAKSSDDWSTIIDEEDETATVTYRSDTFTKEDEGFLEETMNTIFSLNNGEVSAIMEEDDGYYVFFMKNNNSTENYDSEVENAISDVENEKFAEYFEKLKSEKYTVKVYDNNWNSVIFGSITL